MALPFLLVVCTDKEQYPELPLRKDSYGEVWIQGKNMPPLNMIRPPLF